MEKQVKEVLQKLENHGFEAYIVGGYVRDTILGYQSTDIDICTNATPKEITAIFHNIRLPREEYGSVDVFYKGTKYEVTTYRKDINYQDNRRPETVIYINDLKEDLLRRDFTMNTLCMNHEGKILDLLNGKTDIVNKTIKTVGDPFISFEEDALRILRTIRFATVLEFNIDEKVKKAIKKKRHLIKNLSYYRRKEELDRIFSSIHVARGIKLLSEFKLEKYLELPPLKKIKLTDDFLGIWSQIYNENYPFTKVEREMILDIKACMKQNILNTKTLYQKGPYILSIVASLKGIPKKEVTQKYQELAIKKRSDIAITSQEICECFGEKPGKYIKDVYDILEGLLLSGKLENENTKIKEYLKGK